MGSRTVCTPVSTNVTTLPVLIEEYVEEPTLQRQQPNNPTTLHPVPNSPFTEERPICQRYEARHHRRREWWEVTDSCGRHTVVNLPRVQTHETFPDTPEKCCEYGGWWRVSKKKISRRECPSIVTFSRVDRRNEEFLYTLWGCRNNVVRDLNVRWGSESGTQKKVREVMGEIYSSPCFSFQNVGFVIGGSCMSSEEEYLYGYASY